MRANFLTACVAGPLLAISAFSTSAQSNDPSIVGSWKLVSAKYNGEQFKLDPVLTTLKHVTPEQTLWVTYKKDGHITRAAGGTYTLNGNVYTETPSYGIGKSFKVVRAATHTFTVKFEENKWYLSGALANGLKIEEVWERLAK